MGGEVKHLVLSLAVAQFTPRLVARACEVAASPAWPALLPLNCNAAPALPPASQGAAVAPELWPTCCHYLALPLPPPTSQGPSLPSPTPVLQSGLPGSEPGTDRCPRGQGPDLPQPRAGCSCADSVRGAAGRAGAGLGLSPFSPQRAFWAEVSLPPCRLPLGRRLLSCVATAAGKGTGPLWWKDRERPQQRQACSLFCIFLNKYTSH